MTPLFDSMTVALDSIITIVLLFYHVQEAVCKHFYVEHVLVLSCVVEFEWCTDSSDCSDLVGW